METNENIDSLLARHFAHETLSVTQQKRLNEWIEKHEKEYRQLQLLINAPLEKKIYPSFDTDKAWENVEKRLSVMSVRKKSVHRWSIIYGSIAACLALIVGVAVFYQYFSVTDKQQLYANAADHVKHVILSDSSEVVIYPHSQISFAVGKEREAQLIGKAFFKVKKNGKSFKVSTQQLTVEVLGTSFLVDAIQENEAGVFVQTGRVKVSSTENEVILRENEKAELLNNVLNVGVIDNPSELFGEKKQVLLFNNEPILNVVQTIEKQTGVRIELSKEVERNRVTTRIDPVDSKSIVEELAFVCGCHYEALVEGKHYKLYYE